MEQKEACYYGTVLSLSSNSGALREPHCLSGKAKTGPSKVYQSALRLLQGTATAAAGKSLQSCLTLCDPIDRSLPDSSVLGIL